MVILLFSGIVGFSSIIPSLIWHHRRTLPLMLLVVGLTFIALGRLHIRPVLEIILTVSGALMVAFSHYTNWKFCRSFHDSSVERE